MIWNVKPNRTKLSKKAQFFTSGDSDFSCDQNPELKKIYGDFEFRLGLLTTYFP